MSDAWNSTTKIAELVSDGTTEAAVIRDVAFAAAQLDVVEEARLYSWRDNNGERRVLDLQQYRPAPDRHSGAPQFFDPASFSEYVNRFPDRDPTLWADEHARMIVAVLNDHTANAPGWGDWTPKLVLRESEQFSEWRMKHREQIDQDTFAEFIEERLVDIIRPDAADLLEIAQSFNAKTDVTFRSSKRLVSGETQLLFHESVSTTAGREDQLTVPDVFTIKIPVFEGTALVDMNVRLRYRVTGGHLRIILIIDKLADMVSAAFGDVIQTIESATNVPVWLGVHNR